MKQEVVTVDGKQETIIQDKVDVEKSTSENDVIIQHKAVEKDIDEETAVARMLYEGFYSYEEVIIKNTTEKVVMDTGQYHVVCNMVDVKDKEYYVRLDSRTASEVNGRKTLKVYNLVKATEVGYFRKDSWDQSKFEDPDHTVVTTMSLNTKIDYISADHRGKGMFYGSEFKDKFVEE